MATSTLGSGTLVLAGTTSGTTTVTATAVAGTTTLTLPAATDTLVGKATTDTLTNKTLTGAAMNGTLGATTPSTGAFTTLTSTSASSLATSSGSVGIGTASPPEKLSVSGAGMFTGQLGNLNANSFSIDVQSSPLTARLTAVGADGSTNLPMMFAVCTTTTYTERMRIDTSGNLLVGTTSLFNAARLTVQASSNATYAADIISRSASDEAQALVQFGKFSNDSTTSQIFVNFIRANGSQGSGQINANGANQAAFGTYSDSRLKENIVDLPSQLANIMALRPVEYDYIESEGGGHQIGFIAQEVKEIYPDLVGERKDGMFTLADMNKNDARLIKAIQEQQALITTLTARITALESA